MANEKRSKRDRVQNIADTVRLDGNGTPVLILEVRYYPRTGGHLYLRGDNDDGTVAEALAAKDLAEAVVLAGDVVRRANGKAMRLLQSLG